MVGDGDRDVVVLWLDPEAVSEVHVLALEPLDEDGGPGHREVVPAHVRHRPGADAAHPAGEKPKPSSPFLARAEQELHADADAEDRAPGGDAVPDRLVEPVLGEPPRRALHVADTGDHGERGLPDRPAANVIVGSAPARVKAEVTDRRLPAP